MKLSFLLLGVAWGIASWADRVDAQNAISCAGFDLGNGATADVDNVPVCNNACTQSGMMPEDGLEEPVPVIDDDADTITKTFECFCQQDDSICGPTDFEYELPPEQKCKDAGVTTNEECIAACRNDIAPWIEKVSFSNNGGSIVCYCHLHPSNSPRVTYCDDGGDTSAGTTIIGSMMIPYLGLILGVTLGSSL